MWKYEEVGILSRLLSVPNSFHGYTRDDKTLTKLLGNCLVGCDIYKSHPAPPLYIVYLLFIN